MKPQFKPWQGFQFLNFTHYSTGDWIKGLDEHSTAELHQGFNF